MTWDSTSTTFDSTSVTWDATTLDAGGGGGLTDAQAAIIEALGTMIEDTGGGVWRFKLTALANVLPSASQVVVALTNTEKRRLVFPYVTSAATLTGTVRWDGQAEKAIAGAITYEGYTDSNGLRHYLWTHDAADRPATPKPVWVKFTDGAETVEAAITYTDASGLTAAQADQLTAVETAIGNVPLATENAAATRTELATELARIDAAISTRSTLAAGAAMGLSDGAITAAKIVAEAMNGKGDWNTVEPDNASIASILEDTGTTLPGLLATIAGYVDTEVAAIKDKTDNLPADPATESTLAALDLLVDAIKAVTDQVSVRLRTIDVASGNITGTPAQDIITIPDASDVFVGDAVIVDGGAVLTVAGISGNDLTLSDEHGVGGIVPFSVTRQVLTSLPPNTDPAGLTVSQEAKLNDILEDTGTTLQASLDSLGANVLTGPNVVTVTVVDNADSTPIENANVRVFRTGESGTKVTNASGVAEFATASATFTRAVTASGYAGSTASLVVDGDETVEVRLVATSIAAPSDPSLCAVACYARTANNVPIRSAKVTAKLLASNSAVDGIVVSTSEVCGTTDSAGLVTLELYRLDQFTDGDGKYKIEVFDGATRITSITTTIPNAATAYLEDLIPA